MRWCQIPERDTKTTFALIWEQDKVKELLRRQLTLAMLLSCNGVLTFALFCRFQGVEVAFLYPVGGVFTHSGDKGFQMLVSILRIQQSIQ